MTNIGVEDMELDEQSVDNILLYIIDNEQSELLDHLKVTMRASVLHLLQQHNGALERMLLGSFVLSYDGRGSYDSQALLELVMRNFEGFRSKTGMSLQSNYLFMRSYTLDIANFIHEKFGPYQSQILCNPAGMQKLLHAVQARYIKAEVILGVPKDFDVFEAPQLDSKLFHVTFALQLLTMGNNPIITECSGDVEYLIDVWDSLEAQASANLYKELCVCKDLTREQLVQAVNGALRSIYHSKSMFKHLGHDFEEIFIQYYVVEKTIELASIYNWSTETLLNVCNDIGWMVRNLFDRCVEFVEEYKTLTYVNFDGYVMFLGAVCKSLNAVVPDYDRYRRTVDNFWKAYENHQSNPHLPAAPLVDIAAVKAQYIQNFYQHVNQQQQ